MITEDHYTTCPCILQLFGCMQRLIEGSNFSLCFPNQFDISWISGGCDSSKKKTQEDVSSGFSLNLNLLVISCVWCHVCTCILFPISCWHHVFFSVPCVRLSSVRLELLNSSLCLPICSFTNFLSVDEVSNILLVSDNQFRGKYGINCLQHCLLISCNRAWHQLLHLLSLEPKTCR